MASKAGTPVPAGKKMSSSLKERLKRSSRYFSSPVTKGASKPAASGETASLTAEEKGASNISKTGRSSEESEDITSERLSDEMYCGEGASENATKCGSSTETEVKQSEVQAKELKTEVKLDIPQQNVPVKVLESEEFSENNQKLSDSNMLRETSLDCQETDSLDTVELRKLKANLEETIKQKEDLVRKLKMVKMYRAKNDLTTLGHLIDKWRGVCQEAVTQLHDLTTAEPKPSLSQLINHLQLDHTLLGFNEEDESFE